MKKIFLFLSLFLISSSLFAANLKISELTEDTAPTSDDLTVTVNSPSSGASTKKATLSNLSKGLNASNIPNVAAGGLAATDIQTAINELDTEKGVGDVTAAGDCTSAACFDGTSGTTLTFDNAGGDGTLSYNGTSFTFSKSITTNSGGTTISSTGGITLNSGGISLGSSGSVSFGSGITSSAQVTVTSNSLTSGTGLASVSSSNSMTGRLLKSSYTGTSSGNGFESEITNASASGIAAYIKQYGTGNALQIDDVSGDSTPTVIDQDGNLTVGNLLKLRPTASPPGSPASGDIYVDSTPSPDELCFYDGSAWQGLSSGTDANCA